MQSQEHSRPVVKRFHKTPTLDQWLSHSVIVPMASGPEDSFVDDTSSSLGDSTYDFLDDKSAFTTDDEDASNLTKSTTSNDAQDFEIPAIEQSQNTAHTVRPSDDTASPKQNDAVTKEDDQRIIDDDHTDIKLDEPFRYSADIARSVEGSHTLRIFDELEVKEMKNIVGAQAPLSQLKATVRQTMAGNTMSLRGPFKLLYIGENAAKDTIVQKIGSALTASLGSSMSRLETPGSSRFSVVPISSFGETRAPEVLLVDSLGIEIRVDHCASATFARKEDSNDSISLRLSNGMVLTSTWSLHESKFIIAARSPGWELPQLAVFYLSDTETMEAKQTRRFARSFLSRHKVSCLVITQSQLWSRSTEAMTLDHLTPHLCLETSGLDNVRPRVIKRLPIDLATFVNLDAVQVNRNLACLAEASSSAETKFKDLPIPKDDNVKRELIADETGRCSIKAAGTKYLGWVDSILETIHPLVESPISALFLLTLAVSCLGLVPYFAYSGSAISNASGFQPVPISTLEHLRTGAKSKAVQAESALASHLASTTPTRAALPSLEAASHANTDLASFLLDSHALTPNNSAKFKVHVVGEHHVVLRPPHWFMRYRKAPKLVFNITRKDKSVEHELSMLFDGVYALKISREDAHGLLDVSVRTTSKPKINETFQVDFGNSWLRIDGWKDVARSVSHSIRKDLQLVQTGLSILRAQTNIGIQTYTRKVVGKMHSVGRDLIDARDTALNRTAITTDLMLAQTKGLSQVLSSKFNYKGAVLTKQLSLHGRQVRSNLHQYAGSKAAALKQNIKIFSRTIRSINIKAVGQGVQQLRQDQLRLTQKKALKAWWKIAGVPKATSGGSVSQGPQRRKGLRSRKTDNK